MKRLLLHCLMGIFLVQLVGCGTPAKRQATAQVPTLVWYVPGDKQADLASVLEKVNEIAESAIGARLDLQFIDTSSYEERMKMNMASGNDYDLCFTGYLNDYQQAAVNGGLLDITDLIDTAAPGLKTLVPDYFLEAAKIHNRIYGVPNVQVISNPDSLVIEKNIANCYQFDFSKVKKIDDIEPYLDMVKKNETNIYPLRVRNNSINLWLRPVYDYVLDGTNVVIRKDGSSNKLSLAHETEEFQKGLHTLRDWYTKGYIRSDVASAGDDTTDYKMGKYAVSGDSWKPGAEVLFKKANGREAFYIPLFTPYVQRHSALLTMISVNAKTKNPEKAVQFIELVNRDQTLYNLLCFGIEGKHYTKNEQGKVVYTENSGYAPKADWKFGNQFNAYLLDGMEDDIYERTKEMNSSAMKSVLLGFVPDTTNITNEISQIVSINKEYAVMHLGAVEPEKYWNEYLSKLEKAGQQKVLEELQRQVDEFMKAKN